MKIALLTHSVHPRGGVVHTLELARALHEAGHEVVVFVPAAPGQRLFRATPHRVELVPVEAAPPDVPAMVRQRIAAFVRHIAALPDRASFELWHAQDSLGGNALAELEDRGLVDGFVRTVHHLDRFDDARLRAWQQRAVERARRVFCVSALWQRVLREADGVDAARVPNGVDLQRFRPQPEPGDAEVVRRLGLEPGAPLWLMVGGVEERKNTLRAFEAFVLHRARHPNAQLVIAGGASLLDHDAYQARFRAAVAATGVKPVLTGALPDPALPALMRAADGLLMPSLREGFGLVALEALACGAPVVVSRQAPFTEYLGEHDAAWADPHDAVSIAAAMDHALARPPHGVPEVCRRHGWAASAERHLALYRELLATA